MLIKFFVIDESTRISGIPQGKKVVKLLSTDERFSLCLVSLHLLPSLVSGSWYLKCQELEGDERWRLK